MKKIIYTLIPLFLSLPALAYEEIELEVAHGGQHEECFFIDKNTTVTYQYETSSPLDFNFHFHDDNGMTFLTELEASHSHSASIKELKSKQVYCLMWINTSKTSADLSYEFTIE